MAKKTINTSKYLGLGSTEGITFSSGGSSGISSGVSPQGSSFPNNLYKFIPPPNIPGAWQVTKASKQLSRAEDLTKHHSYHTAEADPTQISGFWSKRVDYAGRNAYVYDLVLRRIEDASLGGDGKTLTKTPWVPSPVDGEITRIGFYSNKKDTNIEIKSTSGEYYVLLHMDVPYVQKNGNPSGKKWKKGDKVKRGELLARQSDFMNLSKFKKNIHLHIQFENLQVLKRWIIDLVLNSF